MNEPMEFLENAFTNVPCDTDTVCVRVDNDDNFHCSTKSVNLTQCQSFHVKSTAIYAYIYAQSYSEYFCIKTVWLLVWIHTVNQIQ